MAPNYRYFVRGNWFGPANEKPAVIGEKFLRTLDALSGVDPIFSGWQFTGAWQIPEEHRSSFIPLAAGRERIAEIVRSGVYIDDFKNACPEYGHSVHAITDATGSRRAALTVSTKRQDFELSFGEYDLPSDLTVVRYPLFKGALLAISAVLDAHWACAQAFRNDVAKVPIDFAGVPAFKIDSAVQVPLDPRFPKSIFHVPWIAYLPQELAIDLKLPGEILTERMPDGGLLMNVTTDRLDPTNPEHVRRARILAEALIARAATSDAGKQ